MSQLLKNFRNATCLLLLCCGAGFAQAAPPQTVNFQGRLTDLADNPLNGSFDLTFTLYNAASGGVALWTETQTGVVVDNGSAEALLGSVTPIPYSAATSPAAFLQIQVGAELLSPRQPFASVLYSMNSAQLSGRTYDMFMDLSSPQTVPGVKTFGTIIATNSITAARFYGNGAGLTGIIGDSLGDHTAIADLNMSGRSIVSVGTVTAYHFVGNGAGLTGISGDNLGSHMASTALDMANYPVNNVSTLTVNNTVMAANFYGDGSMLTGIRGDNLGSHMATMPLDMSGQDIIAANNVTAAKYYGDGGNLTGISGDNLGSHMATMPLDMSGQDIIAANNVTAANFYGNGATLSGVPGDNLGNHTASTALDMANYPVNNVSTLTVNNTVMAANFYGDGSMLTGVRGDNLGNHTATMALSMGGYPISNAASLSVSSSVTAAKYYGDGSNLTGISTGDDLGSHTATNALNMSGFPISNAASLTVSSNVTAGKYFGDGSALTGIAGDDLGNHTASSDLNMSGRSIVSVGTVTANHFVGNGAGLTGISGDNLGSHTATTALNMAGFPISNAVSLTVSSNVTAGKYYGDGSSLTGIAGDNLGSHTAAMALNMSGYPISNAATLNVSSAVTAAKYYGDGSSLTGIAGDNLGSHTAAMALNMSGYPISNAATVNVSSAVTAAKYYGDGSALTGIAGDDLGNHTASSDLNMSGRSILSVGTVTANNFVGNGSGLTGIPGDNLGSHIAGTALDMAYHQVLNVTTMTVVNAVVGGYFVGDGAGLSNLNAIAKTGGTLTGALNFSGAVPDITAGADEHITIMPAGAGNVGIGEGNPVAKLTVNGDVRATGNLTIGVSGSTTLSVGSGAGESVITAPDNQTLTLKGTREVGLGNAFQVQTYNAAKSVFTDRFTVTGATDTANIAMLNSNVGIGTNNPANQFVLAHGTGVMNKVFLDGTIDDGGGVAKRVVSLSNTDGSNYGGYLALGNRYSPLTGPADGATVLLSGAPNQNSYISVGNVGIGTINPGAKLHVAGGVKIEDGTQGAGKVLTSDSSGLASWQAVSGDNLGDHMATQGLNMGNFPVSNISTITITSGGLFVINGTASDSNGLHIKANGELVTRGFGNGSYMPLERGIGSVDLQTRRALGMDNVAAGVYSTIAGGESNKVLAAADHAFIGGGDRNAVTAGQNGVVSGGYLNTLGGSHGFIGGGYGNTAGGGAYALVTGGKDNVAASQYSAVHGGYYNRVNDIFSEGSMVPGGANLTITNSRYALAAGFWAAVNNADGSFTWNDYHNTGGNSELVNNVPQRTLFKNRGGFLITGSTNTTMSGMVDRGMFVSGNGLVGIAINNPQAALDVVAFANGYAQIWRDSSGIVVSSMSAAGVLYPQSTPAGDNLGNHTATMALQMGVYAVNTSSYVNAGAFHIGGTKVLAVLPGIDSLGVGLGAGRVDTGNNNVFVGYRAGYSNTNGFSNTFLGHQAGYSTTSGYNNTYVGQNVGYFNTTGIMNSMLGAAAGYSNTTGSNNTFMGDYAGNYNQTGSGNALFGFGTGGYGVGSVHSFSSSTVVGYKAGYMLGNGSADNTLIGFQAGDSLTTGSRNIIIGYNQDATAPTISNELNIGGIIWGNLQTGAVGLGLTTTLPQAALDVKSTGTAADQMAQVWRNSGGTIVSSVSATGVLTASRFVSPMGGSTGQTTPIGLAGVNLNSQATTGTAEEALLSYTLPANSLNANSKGVRIRAWGTAVNNSMTKILRLRFGGIAGTIVANHTSMSESNWTLEAVVFRTGANTQKGLGVSLSPQETIVSAPAQADTAAIDVALTGETSITLGEVSAEGLMVEFIN